MKSLKQMYQASFANLKKNWVNSLILGLVCGFFIASVFLINILVGGIGTILVLLLGLPFFFACFMINRSLMFDGEVSFSSIFLYTLLFWRRPFRSTFRLWSSLLRAVLFNLLISIFLAVICYFAFQSESTFLSNLDDLMDAINKSFSIEYINTIFEKNDYQLLRYLCACIVPGGVLQIVVFTQFILIEQISMYHRVHYPQLHPAAHHLIFKNSISGHRKTFYKYFYGLNFIFFLLLIIGGSLGVYIAYFLFGYDSSSMIGIGYAGAALLGCLYLPVVFYNQEAIYEQFAPIMQDTQLELIKEVTRRAKELQGIAKAVPLEEKEED